MADRRWLFVAPRSVEERRALEAEARSTGSFVQFCYFDQIGLAVARSADITIGTGALREFAPKPLPPPVRAIDFLKPVKGVGGAVVGVVNWTKKALNDPIARTAPEPRSLLGPGVSLRGRGVRIGIADTGVANNHPGIPAMRSDIPQDDRRIRGYTKADGTCTPLKDTEPPVDHNGHGTRVAGVIVGRNERGQDLGVAPAADLYVAGVTTGATKKWDDVAFVAGLDWLVEKRARIISISLTNVDKDPSPAHELVLSQLRARNILPIVAVGNFHHSGKSGTPGNCSNALSVGALDEHGEVLDISGCAMAKPDAPALPTLLAPGTFRLPTTGNPPYDVFAFTSFAAPFVAGLAALLCEAKPTATAKEIETALLGSALATRRHKFRTAAECPDVGVVDFDHALAALLGS